MKEFLFDTGLLWFIFFILLVILAIILRDQKTENNRSIGFCLLNLILFIPISIINLLIFDNLNITTHLLDNDKDSDGDNKG